MFRSILGSSSGSTYSWRSFVPAVGVHTSCPETLCIKVTYDFIYICSSRSNLHFTAHFFHMMYEMSEFYNLYNCFIQDHLVYILPDEHPNRDRNM
jgi:hypothetical protein